MAYSNVALKNKIQEMYPEINQNNIAVGLDFNDEKDAYEVTFKKNRHELSTYIDKSDANECMDGVKCVHLSVKIGEFIKNYQS